MKKIEAIIRPEKVSAALRALGKAGHPGIMVTEIEGHGKQKGVTHQWHGEEYKVELLSKMKLELIVTDAELERTIKVITDAVKTGEIGDGKIFIYNVEDAVRVRTGERGDGAI